MTAESNAMALNVPKYQDSGKKLSDAHFRAVKARLLTDNTFDPNLWSEMDSYQRYWVVETKRTLRQFVRNDGKLD